MYDTKELQLSIHELQVTKLHEAIAAADHVTVEFGTGSMPLFEAEGGTSFNRDNLYVGINLDSKQHNYLASTIESVDGFAVLGETGMTGGIDRLPIVDSSADTVFMANVFGEPDSPHIMEQFKDINGQYRGNSTIDAKVQTLEEARRLLKPGGRIVVLENNTPYMGGFTGKYDSMVKLLEKAGLAVVDAVNQQDDDWVALVSQFAKPVAWWSYGSYLVVAQKPDDQ